MWINKGELVSLGSDTLTRSGNVVMLRGSADVDAPILCKAKFEWEPFATVTMLRAMARTGETYTANIEDNGTTHQIEFAKDAVTSVKSTAYGDDIVHSHLTGHHTDLYDGELSFYIVG